jgi:hypothetical protein
MEAQEGSELKRYYEEKIGKFSCQPFILYHLPGKKINMERLISELKGDLKIETISTENYNLFNEFKDEHGELFKKITIIDTSLMIEPACLMLMTHETERLVFFRNKEYLVIDTNFVLLKIELIEETYYLYVFANRGSISSWINSFNKSMSPRGLMGK